MRDGPWLGIETSNPSAGPCGVAVARREGGAWRALAITQLDLARSHDQELLPAIDRAMAEAGLKPRALAGVAVSVGPGGFTSVRIAVSTAKMIAEATGAECVGVPSAQVGARRVEPGTPFAVAMGAKGESAWVTTFDGAGRLRDAGALLEPGSLDGLGVGRLVADAHLPNGFAQWAERCGVQRVTLRLDPVACLEAAEGLAPVDPAGLLPLYPREPEAVTQWRARHGGR